MKKFDAPAPSMISLCSKFALVVSAAMFAVGCQSLPEEPLARGEHVYNHCQACHGPQGQGMPEYGAPAIAGMPAWYVEAQVTKFQTGVRGAHADDHEGLRMRPLSKTVRSEEDLKAVAAYVSNLPAVIAHPKTVQGGDPGRGAEYFKTCVACHGADGLGMQALNAPSLMYQQDWYLLRQLEKFADGRRGRLATDITGMQMAAMISSVPDEQAKKDVVAYIQKLKMSPSTTTTGAQ